MLERLKQYNSYLESLAGKLSHELRTPMTVVQSSLENLQSRLSENDRVYLERAREGVQRLQLLVARLSEAARLEQALQSAEPESHDLCRILQQAVEGYRMACEKNRFDLVLPSEAVIKNLSADLFLQMLDKIISNAVDFSTPGEPVRVELSANDNQIKLDIINYGSALPEAMQGQLFNSMVSLRGKGENKTPHLGLGLYIARMIAEFHGGHIKAENLADQKGVCFSVIFPV
jgi:signal transduction histidine kinase